MQSHPLQPILIPLAMMPASSTNVLTDGQQVNTIVQGQAQQPFLMLAGKRIPLPETSLLPGQAVTVEVTSEQGALQLRISPQAVTTSTPQTASPVSQLAMAVLERLGSMELPSNPEALVPAALPIARGNIQELFSLLMVRNRIGEDLQLLNGILQQAVTEGVISSTLLSELTFLALPSGDWDARKILTWMKSVRGSSKPEAKLQAALRQGTVENVMQALRQTFLQQLQGLRGRDALITWMRAKGMLKILRKAGR